MSENLVSWWTFVWWAECGLSWAAGLSEPGVLGMGFLMAIPDIGRSVKPISTRLADYYLRPQIFRPSYGPVVCGWSSDNDKSGLSGIKKDSTLSISRCFPPNSNSSDLFAKAHLLSPFVQENRSMDTFSRKIVLKSMWIINQLNRIQSFVWCRKLSKFHRGLMIPNKWSLLSAFGQKTLGNFEGFYIFKNRKSIFWFSWVVIWQRLYNSAPKGTFKLH